MSDPRNVERINSALRTRYVKMGLRNPFAPLDRMARDVLGRQDFALNLDAKKLAPERALSDLEDEDERLRKRKKFLYRSIGVIEELHKWVESDKDWKIEAQATSAYAQLAESLARNDLLDFNFEVKGVLLDVKELSRVCAATVAHERIVFLVGHDWAGAFEKAQDYEAGEWRLPSDHSAFEFQVNGRRVVVTADADNGSMTWLRAFIPTGYGWALMTDRQAPHDGQPKQIADDIRELFISHIRAICIGLDAEIIASTPERLPHKSNLESKDAKVPVKHDTFHTLSLARRHKVARLPGRDGDPARHNRLHFRRGHWRHYETWKTWIRWTLCGDPDLGFVDKQYRL